MYKKNYFTGAGDQGKTKLFNGISVDKSDDIIVLIGGFDSLCTSINVFKNNYQTQCANNLFNYIGAFMTAGLIVISACDLLTSNQIITTICVCILAKYFLWNIARQWAPLIVPQWREYLNICNEINVNIYKIMSLLSGFDMDFGQQELDRVNALTIKIGDSMPILKDFIVSNTELSSLIDQSRTKCREIEPMLAKIDIDPVARKGICAYMNRLSSLLFQLVRKFNYKEIKIKDYIRA